ncbi:MAG: sugar phosphate isomerase/epimerase [Planctomycetes bacterium]|nr:sugar phosphate isomerase/epimerase [Planctomycetota bacterium]
MRLGYGTNSIGDVDPLEAVPILAEVGYRSLAITPDRHLLDPFAADLTAGIDAWRRALGRHGMACVVETGARHLLDPRVKHEPTLVSPSREARQRRVEFTQRAIDIAAELGADCVSLWSGAARDSADSDTFWQRLTEGLGPILDHAARRGMRLGLEPEPGMVVDTVACYAALLERLGHPAGLGLTIDTGHLECLGERPAAAVIARWATRIVNVHVDDMLPCRHEHLPLGEGDVDFAPLVAALAAADYAGGLHVELPRQAHRWLETAAVSARFLAGLLPPP